MDPYVFTFLKDPRIHFHMKKPGKYQGSRIGHISEITIFGAFTIFPLSPENAEIFEDFSGKSAGLVDKNVQNVLHVFSSIDFVRL